MNTLQTGFRRVLSEYAKYQAAKKRAPKYTGLVTPRLAKSYAQKAQQELVVFEMSLVQFQGIMRRARLTPVQTKNAKRVVSIFKKYISDIENVYKKWSKYTSKNTTKSVSIQTFPVKMPHNGKNFTVKLDVAINAYMKALQRTVETQSQNTNLPIIPFKSNSVNLRGMTMRGARQVKSPATALRNDVDFLRANLEERRRRNAISASEYNALRRRARNLAERVEFFESMYKAMIKNA